MRYKLTLSVDIDAQSDPEAFQAAKKLGEMLKNPLVRMSLESDGIRPVGDAVVYKPQRA